MQISSETQPRDIPLEQLRPGSGVSFRYQVSAEEVNAFARLTGDFSPIHMGDEAARQSGFSGRIAHGMLVASLCSTVVGMFLPGRSGVLTSCAAEFLEPVTMGRELCVSARIRQVSKAVRSLRISVIVTDRGIAVCKALVGAGVRASKIC